MKKVTAKIFVLIIVSAAVLGLAVFYYGSKPGIKEVKPVACTQEAKLCPDGSAVGRTGPNCEFAACPSATDTGSTGRDAGILPYNSGVRGTVLLGPTCPVQRMPPDSACADRPYSATISVYRAGASALYATGKSDANGMFQFSLPPGSYALKAASGSVFPRCNGVDVTVGPSGYATTTISCDTGIR